MNSTDYARSISEQVGAIRALYPQFKIIYDRRQLKIVGEVKPTPRSSTYHFILRYILSEPPSVSIVAPLLIKNEKGEKIPHLYSDGSLCMYRPLRKEFQYSKLIANTIIPWISLWLYYYEVWHMSGEWLGGGEHPEKSVPYEQNT